jgi:hypothetical protein
MKCKHCGGRVVSLIVEYVEDREYDEKDNIISQDLKDYSGDQPDTVYCNTCGAEGKILVEEVKKRRKK